jgi:hypothetical protein
MAIVKRGILGTGALTVALVSGTLAARVSSAEPINVTFTVFPSPLDILNTRPSTGSFTFDSARVPFRGRIQQTLDGGGLATDIFLRWGSTVWTTANAGVWLLAVDPTTGRLHSWGLVGPQSGGIITSPAEDVVDLINIGVHQQRGFFEYTNQGHEGAFEGRVQWRQFPTFTPVPEPGTLLLFGSGALYLIRRRSRLTAGGGSHCNRA